MARLNGPLFSLGASGQVGKALVYADWKGINYARRYVVPANPKSTDQVEVRTIFQLLNEMWKRFPFYAKDPWTAGSRGKPFTNRNLHIGKNAAVLQGETDMDNLVMSVASGQSTQPTAVTVTPGAGTLTVACTEPIIPSGYSLNAVMLLAVLDGDPSPAVMATADLITYLALDYAAPWAPALAGLAAGDYQCGVVSYFIRTADQYHMFSEAVRDKQTVT